MTDSNPTRERFTANRKAFEEVLGDPFAAEPVDGWYNTFKQRGTVGSQRYNFDEGHGTENAARPTQLDFFCDVEKIVQRVIPNKMRLQNFVNTYIVGDVDSNTLTQAERTSLEQRIGKLLRAYRIVPVSNYFTALRTGAPQG